MRYMIIVKSSPQIEAGPPPAPESFEAMGKFNDQLIDAGVLLAAEGLRETAKGMKVKKVGDKHVVTDGPFTEAKELVAGFWIIQAKSRDEVLAWAKRIPLDDGEEVEVRQVAEASDFEGIISDEEIAKEQAWRDANQKPVAN